MPLVDHNTELERSLLAGLPEWEREQTIESMREQVARDLERLRNKVGQEAQESF
jgi:DNA-binding MarR family transcriptional regulator